MSFFAPSDDIYLHGPAVHLPERVMTNQDVVAWMGASVRPSWIAHRTGVEERRWVRADQACSDLATAAAEALLAARAIDRAGVAQLILATVSGDYPTPPTAPLVVRNLALPRAGALELSTACAGFVSGLHVGAALHAATGETQLLVAADIRSKFLRPRDLATVALFGDGAASCLIAGRSVAGQLGAGGSRADFRLVASKLVADGSAGDLIAIRAGGSRLPYPDNDAEENLFLHMRAGASLFLKGVELMAESARSLLDRLGLGLGHVDWVVPHQANLRLIRAMADKLGLDPAKLVETVQYTGNTAGASVGIALGHLRERLPVQPGQRVLLVSAGAGGAAASALLECL